MFGASCHHAIIEFVLQILVWHTRTSEPNMKGEELLQSVGNQSDPSLEV